jgi:hypothetical protein
MPVEVWMLIVAVIFTVFGYSVGVRKNMRNAVEIAIGTTIDNLIRDGYLKTRGVGKDMEILKIVDDETD